MKQSQKCNFSFNVRKLIESITIYNIVLYLLSTSFLNIFLNCIIEVHSFSFLSRLFHKSTPITDIHLPCVLVLAPLPSITHVPLRLYWVSLFLNISWIHGGSVLLYTLYINTAVFRLTKSSNFNAFLQIKSGFEAARYSALFRILMAFFCSMNIGFMIVLYVFPHTSTQ